MVAAVGSVGTYGGPNAGVAIAQMAVPGGTTPGDVILAWLWKTNTAAVTTLPSGFAEAVGSPVSTTTNVQSMHLFWKRVASSDAGTYDFSWTGNATAEFIAERYIGCAGDGADPFDFVPTLVQRSSSGTVSPAVSGTTTKTNSLLVWRALNFAVSSWTAPAGFTLNINNSRMGGAYLLQAAAGATGSITGTAAVSSFQMAAMVSLRSATDVPKSRHNHQAAIMRASYY